MLRLPPTKGFVAIMLDRAQLRMDMRASEVLEEQYFEAETQTLYKSLQDNIGAEYNEMSTVTNALINLNGEILQTNPRIIKMLRYAAVPTVSQMRLGQIAGVHTTSSFESGTKATYEQATKLAKWLSDHLDRDRFIWIRDIGANMTEDERNIAQRYARLWTISLISNQNTATGYRNKRKKVQEEKIAQALE